MGKWLGGGGWVAMTSEWLLVLEDITESLLFQLIYFALYSQPGDITAL